MCSYLIMLAFKDALLSAGTSIPNTKMKIARLSGLLNYAVDNDLIPITPAKGLVIAEPQAARNKRIGFDRNALAALLSRWCVKLACGGPENFLGAVQIMLAFDAGDFMSVVAATRRRRISVVSA